MGGKDKKEEKSDAFTSVAAESGSQGDGGAVEVCVCGLHRQAGAVASTGQQSLTRHRVSAGRGASLSLSQMWQDLPGVSAGSEPGPEFGSSQRAGGDVVPVGTLLWSGVASVRQLGRGALQDVRLRDRASGCRPRAWTQARAGLPGDQNQGLRRGFDKCEMCWAMAAFGSDSR